MSDPKQSSQAPGLTMGDIYFILFRRKWIILFFIAMAVVGTAVVCVVKPPRYQSDAELFIRYVVEGNPLTTSKDDATTRPLNVQEDGILDTEKQILQSLDVAQQVVDVVGAERILAKINGGTNRDAAAGAVLGYLKVQLPLGGSVISISYEHPDPNIAKDVLRQVIFAYINKHKEIHRPVEIFGDFLPQETKRLQDQLDETERNLKEAKNKAGIISLEDANKTYAEEKGRIREDLFETQAALVQHESALGEATNLLSVATAQSTNTEPQVPVEVVAKYRNVCGQLDSLSRKEQELLVSYTEDSDPVKELRERISDVRRLRKKLETENPQLLTMVIPSNSSQPALGVSIDPATEAVQVRALKSKLVMLSSQMNQLEDERRKVLEMEDIIQELQRKKMVLDVELKNLLSSLENARMEQALGAGKAPNIGVVQWPTPPVKGWSKQFKKKLMMFLGGCLGAGFGLAFVLELFLDRSVKRPTDVTGKLKLPLFITIPHLSGNGSAHVTDPHAPEPGTALMRPIASWDHDHPLRRFYEGLRDRLIVHFEIKKIDHKPKIIGVTSCGKGAGVTSIAAGLAASLSETGDGNVLLVDLNSEQGASQPFFRGKPACPLDDALATETMQSAMVQSKLYVATEVVENEKLPRALPGRFASLMPKLKASEYDYIIFDMPPISQTSMTLRAARLMDLVLFVMESEKTSQDVAKQAVALLAESKVSVHVALNKARTYVPSWLHQELLNDG